MHRATPLAGRTDALDPAHGDGRVRDGDDSVPGGSKGASDRDGFAGADFTGDDFELALGFTPLRPVWWSLPRKRKRMGTRRCGAKQWEPG